MQALIRVFLPLLVIGWFAVLAQEAESDFFTLEERDLWVYGDPNYPGPGSSWWEVDVLDRDGGTLNVRYEV